MAYVMKFFLKFFLRRTPKNPKKPFYGKFCRALCGTKEGAKGCANVMSPAKVR